MVTCKLYGRLGNQMFISAAAISYALKNGHEYHIPNQSENERLWPAFYKNLTNPKYSRFADTVVLKEKGHAYQELNYDPAWADKNIVLDGFFQSEQYFEDYIDEVRAAFKVAYDPLPDFVGIHIRRGDYMRFPDKHPPVTFDYIKKSVAYFVEHNYKSFVVCSDDMLWSKETCEKIKKQIPSIEFSYSSNRRAIDDLAVLSCCGNAILSNSSFSLMAFILNPAPEKFCIAPANWFGEGNAHLRAESIYPKNCIKL